MRRTVAPAAFAAVAVLAVAGCGGGSNGSSTPSPGTGSPAAAVVGILRAWEAQNAQDFCTYVSIPNVTEAQCVQVAPTQVFQQKVTGSFSIGRTVTQGNQALVSVTGGLQVNGTPVTSSDPSTGLPDSTHTFEQIYAQRTDPAHTQTPKPPTVFPCVKQGSAWKVGFG